MLYTKNPFPNRGCTSATSGSHVPRELGGSRALDFLDSIAAMDSSPPTVFTEFWRKNNESDETLWRLYAINRLYNYYEVRMDDVYFLLHTSLRWKEQQSLQRGRWRSTKIPFMCYDCMRGQDMKESWERQSWGAFPSLQSLLAIV